MKFFAKTLAVSAIIAAACLNAKDPVAAPDAAAGTVPPSEYVIDYYAPPTDWFPAAPISGYNQNTRVPDLFWLKYDGAYTLALRIKPIAKAKLEKAIEVGIIDKRFVEKNKVLEFLPERDRRNNHHRRITVNCLGAPGDDFIEFSFKMKAKTKTPDPEVIVTAGGIPGAAINTLKNADPGTVCKDGFKSYKVQLKPRANAKVQSIDIILPPAAELDPDEEYVFFDLNLKRSAPRARFTDLPQRQWIRRSAFEEDRPITVKDGIKDVVAYINSNPADIKSFDLPMKDYVLRQQKAFGNWDQDSGFQVENTTAEINGKTMPAVRITLTKGTRCYLKFPVREDGKCVDMRDYNTLSFYSKVELFEGVDKRFVYGDDYPNLYGTNSTELNRYFDAFSFGLFSATKDYIDWSRNGVSQGLTAWNRERDAKVPEGWLANALDVLHSDRAGNKGTYRPEITHWCFYYNNSKIPEGKKVVVTIASPRLTSGLMHAGGNMELYKKFLKEKTKRIQDINNIPAKDAYTLKRESERLKEPIPFIRDHVPLAEIIAPRMRHEHKRIVLRPVNYMQKLLNNKYGLTKDIPVLDRPSEKDNVKIFLGGTHFRAVDQKQFDEDRKKLKGTSGFAIRTRGKNVYIYADPRFNFAGEARGLASAVYFFLENNTDELVSGVKDPANRRSRAELVSVFGFERDGNMDLVWPADFLITPPVKYWNIHRGGSMDIEDRLSLNAPTRWDGGTPEYGGYRNLSTNHWWGYGTYNWVTDEKGRRVNMPNETWGIDYDGKPMVPGCYTGHPCLINVLEKAKEAYLGCSFQYGYDNGQTPAGKSYAYNRYDIMGLWVEDTLKVCQCEKCLTPIRLANGSLVTPSSRAFRSVQFYSNGCAMIHAVNVYANRNTKIESIGYFWMSVIPLFNVSNNYNIRFCPYIRKNYSEPIYAPVNDLFWRDFYRWSQLNVTMSLYEYFLQVGIRPWVDTYMFDLPAEISRGLEYATPESDTMNMANVEAFAHARIFFEPDSNPQDLRRFFIRRIYREAALPMEKFYICIHNFYHKHIADQLSMEFDEGEIGCLAWEIQSENKKGMTVAEELNSYLEEAGKLVKHPASKQALNAFRMEWDKYITRGKGASENLKKCYAIEKKK